jgi:hypothetical protein
MQVGDLLVLLHEDEQVFVLLAAVNDDPATFVARTVLRQRIARRNSRLVKTLARFSQRPTFKCTRWAASSPLGTLLCLGGGRGG